MTSDDYLPASEATTIRVFDEGEHWAIDAANENGTNYTAFVWTRYNDVPFTRDEAINRVGEFADYIGRPDLRERVIVEEKGRWVSVKSGTPK